MRSALRYLIVLALCVTAVAPDAPAQESGQHYLFVSSRNDSSVKRFDGVTGEFIDNFIEPGAGGDLYVSGRGNAHILRFDGATGAFLGAFTWGYSLDNPTKMTFGPDGMLYVSQWGMKHSAVARFNAVTGQFVDEATSVPLEEGMAHTWDAQGRLYVASYGSKDVRRFDPEGRLIDVFVTSEHLASAVNLWFGEGGDLFVVDWEAGSVLRYDGATGEYIGVFISGMTRSEGVTVGPDGALYVCDWQENTVNRYDAKTGKHLGVFAAGGGMIQPNGVVFRTLER